MQGLELDVAEDVEMWQIYNCGRNASIGDREGNRVMPSVTDTGKWSKITWGSKENVELVLVTIAKEGVVKEAEQGGGACLLHFPKALARPWQLPLPNVTLALHGDLLILSFTWKNRSPLVILGGIRDTQEAENIVQKEQCGKTTGGKFNIEA